MINLMLRYLEVVKRDPVLAITNDSRNFIVSNRGLAGAGTLDVIKGCVKYIDKDKYYLEVGIFQGTNFIGVAKSVTVPCVGVDNFCQEFDENKLFPGMTTRQVVESKIDYHKINNAILFESDFRDFLQNNKRLYGGAEVYMYDGPHSFQDQVDGVEMAFRHLADEAIVFVDDLASENVQQSRDYLLSAHSELELLLELKGPSNVREYFNQGQVVFKYTRKK